MLPKWLALIGIFFSLGLAGVLPTQHQPQRVAPPTGLAAPRTYAPAPLPAFTRPQLGQRPTRAPTLPAPNAEASAFDPLADLPPLLVTRRVPILEYHNSTFHMGADIVMTTPWFEEQLQWLADNGYRTLSVAEFTAFLHTEPGAALPPARAVLLTFDVGASKFDDYANIVIPALRRHHFQAIFFVMPSRVQDTCGGDLTCWPQLAEWQAEGLISVQSHSLYHIDYATLTPEEIVRDAGHSKAIIEEKLGSPVVALCYPFDSVNPAAFELLPALGYEFAVAGGTRLDRSTFSGDPEPFNLPRYYPYADPAYYPRLIGSPGQTFAQMLLNAVSPTPR